MTDYINYNGKIVLNSAKVLPVNNRCFRYGDGIFESIKVSRGEIVNAENHYKRLINSANTIKLSLPVTFSFSFFCDQIIKLTERNEHAKAARIRFSLFRDDDGFYKPISHKGLFLIESQKLQNTDFKLSQVGLNIGLFTKMYKYHNVLSNIKSCNALLYVMAATYAEESGFDDALIMNEQKHIVEATSSNIFIVKENTLKTPGVDQGCVDGTMRKSVIELAKGNGYHVKIGRITLSELKISDELFLTNAISGIQWVKTFFENNYDNSSSAILLKKLNEKLISK